MRKKEIFAFTILLGVLSMSMIASSMAYAFDIYPVEDASTVVKWDVTHAPESTFSMYFTGIGNCFIEDDSTMSFTVENIFDEVTGWLSVGNATFRVNDTLVARDLVLGVGIFSPFEPGLFVEAGPTNIDALNDSAYAAAARVSGNYMNGTMISTYENVTVGQIEYEAITFDYVQDTPFAGDPQRTRLTYAITTGVLLYANTSYWFGEGFEPYWLEIEFVEITHEGIYMPPTILITIIIGTITLVLLVVMVVVKRR
ncbi:MAG: hypothetical protein RTV31_09495 [Candidatus Thorarchaeota archaeon]